MSNDKKNINKVEEVTKLKLKDKLEMLFESFEIFINKKDYKEIEKLVAEKVNNVDIKNIKEYVVIGIETTGNNIIKHKIIEIAVCKVKNGNIIDEYTAFVNPKQRIHQAVTEATGITNDMLKEAETIDIVLPKLLRFIGQLPIVVHHSYYIMRFIMQNCRNLNISLENQIIDTLLLCKKKLPGLKNHLLKTVLRALGYDESEINNPMDYAKFTFKVFEKIKT